ncbi:cyclic nucleotide-binding domain-containing protein, partial [Myxococcota bacterium]|nr:cyclic nucleotide-binding domain-containing protein [Myxococcota bacterium]
RAARAEAAAPAEAAVFAIEAPVELVAPGEPVIAAGAPIALDAAIDEPVELGEPVELDEPVELAEVHLIPGVPVFGAPDGADLVFADEDEPLEDVLAREAGWAPSEPGSAQPAAAQAGGLVELQASSLVELDERDLAPDTTEAPVARVEAPPPSRARPSDELAGLALPQIPLFSELPKEAFISILVEMKMRELAPGAHVIRQGDRGDSFFVIATGRVRVERKNDDGSTTVLAYLTDGAFFGEMALLQDGARVASVIVEEESQIFEIDRSLLERISTEFPNVGRVVRNFYMQRLLSMTMATHALFRSFSLGDRRALMARFKSRAFKAGDVLVREGNRGEGLYLLLGGRLEVTKLKDGEPLAIAELTAGDMFGEMSLLANKPTIATITATTDCIVLRLSKRDFDEVIMTHPQVLELVAKVSEERQTENTAALEGWPPRAEAGAALV